MIKLDELTLCLRDHLLGDDQDVATAKGLLASVGAHGCSEDSGQIVIWSDLTDAEDRDDREARGSGHWSTAMARFRERSTESMTVSMTRHDMPWSMTSPRSSASLESITSVSAKSA